MPDISLSFLRMMSDKAYTNVLRKSSKDMRGMNHVRVRNTIVSNLEWVGNKFLEKPQESQPKMNSKAKVG